MIYKHLPHEDIEKIKYYVEFYGGGNKVCDMEVYLNSWDFAKEKFYTAFGNQFIIEKEIVYKKAIEEIQKTIKRELFKSHFWKNLYNHTLLNYPSGLPTLSEPICLYDNLIDFLQDSLSLAENIYNGNTFKIPSEYTVNHKEITINNGCKMIKAYYKIAKAFGLNDEDFEDFRIAHSQILNQKEITGTLCLSIHPLDFMTMSDNDCGWNSCMSWMEPGDYRLGTVEMMNSPCVIMAYIKSEEPMSLYCCNSNIDDRWNNKKWRQLYIVNKDIILGNKQYPYMNKEIESITINWVKDIVSKKYNWNYRDSTCEIVNYRKNFIDTKECYFDISCYFMYNDVYDGRTAYINPNILNYDNYYLNFSGEAICAECGRIIKFSENMDSSAVVCNECRGLVKCACCGDYTEEPYWVNDNPYCEYCYENEIYTCDCCGEMAHSDEAQQVMIKYISDDEEENKFYSSWFDDRMTLYYCFDCMNDNINSGVIKTYYREFAIRGYYININEIDNSVIEEINPNGSWFDKDILLKLKSLETFEERKEFILDNFA